jgi:hypothetical protein
MAEMGVQIFSSDSVRHPAGTRKKKTDEKKSFPSGERARPGCGFRRPAEKACCAAGAECHHPSNQWNHGSHQKDTDRKVLKNSLHDEKFHCNENLYIAVDCKLRRSKKIPQPIQKPTITKDNR